MERMPKRVIERMMEESSLAVDIEPAKKYIHLKDNRKFGLVGKVLNELGVDTRNMNMVDHEAILDAFENLFIAVAKTQE